MNNHLPANEKVLHFIWRERILPIMGLRGVKGEIIEIEFPGQYNRHAGPDFLEAEIIINGILWVGSVEIHRYSSEWLQHKHHFDSAYNNTVLHVVWINDKEVRRNDDTAIPTLELQSYVTSDGLSRFNELLLNTDPIPCRSKLPDVNSITVTSMLSRCGAERLEKRFEEFRSLFLELDNNWERLLWVKLARYFGFGINGSSFELLAKSIPFQIIQREAIEGNIEALLMGRAGFLKGKKGDSYKRELRVKYDFLKRKYGIDDSLEIPWKFMRMRPYNFPPFRIAQLCSTYSSYPSLFSKILGIKDINEMRSLLSIPANDYWNTHYRFDQRTTEHPSKAGIQSIELLIINCVSPILFCYAMVHDREDIKERVLLFQQGLASESNRMLRQWKETGIISHSAFESQALHHLYYEYCSNKLCLECKIGTSILRN